MKIKKMNLTFIIVITTMSFVTYCHFQQMFLKNIDYYIYYKISDSFDLEEDQKKNLLSSISHSWDVFLCKHVDQISTDVLTIKNLVRENIGQKEINRIDQMSKEWSKKIISHFIKAIN